MAILLLNQPDALAFDLGLQLSDLVCVLVDESVHFLDEEFLDPILEAHHEASLKPGLPSLAIQKLSLGFESGILLLLEFDLHLKRDLLG